jgi:transcriptional regulator with XRE-family HTH domain
MTETREKSASSSAIGERLRSLRKAHSLSIRLLAEKAGLSPNTISLIESNSTSPTVATLQTIANVLDIPLASFFTNAEQDDEVILIKATDQEHQVTPGLNVTVFPQHILDQCVQVLLFTIKPGLSSGSDPMIHPGDELVLCLEGELEYTVKDTTYRLKKLESLSFKGSLPHSWCNPGSVKTHFLVLITSENYHSFRAHTRPPG